MAFLYYTSLKQCCKVKIEHAIFQSDKIPRCYNNRPNKMFTKLHKIALGNRANRVSKTRSTLLKLQIDK